MTPTGIEPVTFRFVVQHLNQCATAVPKQNIIPLIKKASILRSSYYKNISMDPLGIDRAPLRSAEHSLWTNAPTHRRTNPGTQVARATKFCSVVPNICGLPLRNSLRITTFLAPRIFSWFLHIFWKTFAPLLQPQEKKSNEFSLQLYC